MPFEPIHRDMTGQFLERGWAAAGNNIAEAIDRITKIRSQADSAEGAFDVLMQAGAVTPDLIEKFSKSNLSKKQAIVGQISAERLMAFKEMDAGSQRISALADAARAKPYAEWGSKPAAEFQIQTDPRTGEEAGAVLVGRTSPTSQTVTPLQRPPKPPEMPPGAIPVIDTRTNQPIPNWYQYPIEWDADGNPTKWKTENMGPKFDASLLGGAGFPIPGQPNPTNQSPVPADRWSGFVDE